MAEIWRDIHNNYAKQDWSSKPSMFAETAIAYFPKKAKILDLGAGLGQDSRYFAMHGHHVVMTDLQADTVKKFQSSLSPEEEKVITAQSLDLRSDLPFEDESFDVVYAHLSLHYFPEQTTRKIFLEISRILRPGGILAFFTNSTADPEYGTGKQIEPDYFQIDQAAKRYFSVESVRDYVRYFDINVLDNLGETYKDAAKGIHNLIRFIGSKPNQDHLLRQPIPCIGAIVERELDGKRQILMQTRWKPGSGDIYTGTFEFSIGKLDVPFESVFDGLKREVHEETGLKVISIDQKASSHVKNSIRHDHVIGFEPFYCTQQLVAGRPWIALFFVCRVETGTPKAQLSESKDPKWIAVDDLKVRTEQYPEQFFALELPALQKYLTQVKD